MPFSKYVNILKFSVLNSYHKKNCLLENFNEKIFLLPSSDKHHHCNFDLDRLLEYTLIRLFSFNSYLERLYKN